MTSSETVGSPVLLMCLSVAHLALKMLISRANRINWETKTPYAADEGMLLYKQGKKT